MKKFDRERAIYIIQTHEEFTRMILDYDSDVSVNNAQARATLFVEIYLRDWATPPMAQPKVKKPASRPRRKA